MKPALLCICPPYPYMSPPAGAAALLGYLKANDVQDFDFLDLRLPVPRCYEPTYTPTGVFGESYVMDVPDLPLVLHILDTSDSYKPYDPETSPLFDRYCFERGISPAYLRSYLRGLDRFYKEVFEQLPQIDFVGFTVWTSNYLSTLLAASHLRSRKQPPFIVAGGPQVTESQASADLGLRSGLFDAVILGEGEETLLSSYGAFCENRRKPVYGVPGTRYVDGSSGAIQSADRPLLRIKELPLPSFSEMPVDAYQTDDYCTLPIQMSRGCTDKCTFCSEWVFWRRFRLDTVERTVEGMIQLQSLYGANYFTFTDSLLNGSPKRLHAFAEEVLRRRIDISWGGFMRAHMDLETARLLKRAGCEEVFVGIESFSDETLELMNKRRTKADNIRALRAFLTAGIFVVAGFIPGFPGDTRKDFMHSTAKMRELQDEFPGQLRVNTEPFRVSPGQPLYSKLEGIGLVPKNWDEEYFAIAPRYGDITSRIYCSVEGSNQGLERMGRERITFMTMSDALVRTDKFVYAEDEEVSMDSFTCEHVYGGWFLASIKSEASYVYALLVNETEKQELELLLCEASNNGLANSGVSARLTSLERLHVVSPSQRRPQIERILCRSDLQDGYLITVSPFVVARQLGSRFRNQILVANFVNSRWTHQPGRYRNLLRRIKSRPSNVADILRYMKRARLVQDDRRGRAIVRRLKEDGALTISEASELAEPFTSESRTEPLEAQLRVRHGLLRERKVNVQ